MKSKSIILFDGVCNLCNRSVNFVLDRDINREFVFGTLQSEPGKALMREHNVSGSPLSSIILIEQFEQNKSVAYLESEAALRILTRLPGVWKPARIFWLVPGFIRDGIYRWIARNRYRWFGNRDVCRISTAELESRFIEVRQRF